MAHPSQTSKIIDIRGHLWLHHLWVPSKLFQLDEFVCIVLVRKDSTYGHFFLVRSAWHGSKIMEMPLFFSPPTIVDYF